jgi:hypothetical protein
MARQQPRRPDAGSDLDRRLGRRRAPERPLDDRSPDPEIDQVLVTRLRRPPELQRQVLRIRSSVYERVEDVRSPIGQHTPTAREESVWLKVVRDPPALDVEGTTGRPAGMDAITFEDDHFVARPGEREGSCEPRDAAASDDAPHTSKLSDRGDRRQGGS